MLSVATGLANRRGRPLPIFAPPMSLTTAHSLWLAPICLLLGVAMAWLLYRRSKGREGFDPRRARIMAALRAVAVAAIAFFLLEPMLRMQVREVRKPIAVLLHDGSQSLLLAGDTTAVRGVHMDRLQRMVEELGGRYEVRAFTYGERLRDGLRRDQSESLTDLSQALAEVRDRFQGPDLGMVVIDGDGIVNRGRDPRLEAARLGVPVHAIALGDTTVRPDLAIRSVEHNRIAFLGNEFPVTVQVAADHLAGQMTRVSIKQDGAVLAAQDLAVQRDPFRRELSFLIRANKAGVQRYTVLVEPLEGEHTTANNATEFFVEVMDARQRILILAHAPHPDVAALRIALSGVEGYEVKVAWAEDFAGAIEEHDLAVLHQLPSARGGGAWIARAKAKGIPLLAIVGAATDIKAFNAMGAGVAITGAQSATIDALAQPQPRFGLFNVEADLVRAMERFPPLQVPFGQYTAGLGAEVLAAQRIGAVRTEAPLIAVQQLQGQRMAVICGEGLWRWRLADFRDNRSHERFDRLIRKVAQYLALRMDKKRFRVDHAPLFSTREAIVFNAELYNASYEPVSGARIAMQLADSAGREFASVFQGDEGAYRADAGRLAAGRYTWKAQAEHAGEVLKAQGSLVVQASSLEQFSTVADHGLLADIAARTGGRFVRADGLDSLSVALTGESAIPARSYLEQRFTDLVASPWPFALIVLLLSAEWALRRHAGAY